MTAGISNKPVFVLKEKKDGKPMPTVSKDILERAKKIGEKYSPQK